VFFCQGYSEPEAGSDLAALSMAAIDDGDDLVCTGSKIWTTHAGEANWMFALVRTSKTQKKQQGITFVLIDMTSPGLQIRPLVMTSGEEIQNQVFFDEVRSSCRLDTTSRRVALQPRPGPVGNPTSGAGSPTNWASWALRYLKKWVESAVAQSKSW
jgi:alkylation response protein AidB-like acyl-CoA dehydrogenase